MYIKIKQEDFLQRIIDNINKNPKSKELRYKAEIRRYNTGIEIESNNHGYPVYIFHTSSSKDIEVFDIGELIKFNYDIYEQVHLSKTTVAVGFFEESDNIKNSHLRIKRILSDVNTLKYNLASIQLKDISYDYRDLLESDGEYLKDSLNGYDVDEVKPLINPFNKENFVIRIEMTNVILCALVDTIIYYLTLEMTGVDNFIVEINTEYDTPIKNNIRFKSYNVKADDLPKELKYFVKCHPNYDIKKLILNRKYKNHTIKIESKVEGYGMEIHHEGNDLYITIKEFEPDEFNIINLHIDYIKNLDFLLDTGEFDKLIDRTIEVIEKTNKERNNGTYI